MCFLVISLTRQTDRTGPTTILLRCVTLLHRIIFLHLSFICTNMYAGPRFELTLLLLRLLTVILAVVPSCLTSGKIPSD